MSKIDHLITTHYHGDHIGGLGGTFAAASRSKSSSIMVRILSRIRLPMLFSRAGTATLHQDQAQRRKARRQDSDCGPGLAHRDSGTQVLRLRSRQGHAESILCAIQAAERRQPDRRRSVGGKLHHFREIPNDSSRRPDVEPAIRPDVPEQSARHGGSAARRPPWKRQCRVSRCDPSARDRHQQRHAQGRAAGSDEDLLQLARLEDIWQMHFSQLGGQEYTVPGMFIANPFDQPTAAMPVAPFTPPPQGQQAPGPGAQRHGVLLEDLGAAGRLFTVTNTRNSFSKTYKAR